MLSDEFGYYYNVPVNSLPVLQGFTDNKDENL